MRKGSFLRRHFVHPRGPMMRGGEPTRLVLSAHAWGEPMAKTTADAAKLAGKGKKLWTSTGACRSRSNRRYEAAADTIHSLPRFVTAAPATLSACPAEPP
jgi:hypothetical protein